MSEMEPVTDESAPGINKPNAYISARYRQGAVLNASQPSGNYMLAGICAILAAIIYVILLVLLYGDFTALSLA